MSESRELVFTIRKVRLGPAEGDEAGIDEGLAPGDLVVVEGVERLREGSKVAVKGSGPGGTPAPRQ